MRRSQDIKGINIPDQQLKISQYADDATFFVKDPSSLRNLLDLLISFASFSGLKINNSKSHILLLGNHLHPPAQIRGIRIVTEVTILGITVAKHMTEEMQYHRNFKEKLRKIKTICNTWWNRNLSLKGKIVLINSLMISILQYPCTCTATPIRVCTEFKAIVTDFLWNHGRSKISYNLMIQDIQEGGLRLPDLETRIKVIHVNWIKYMWNNPESITSVFVRHVLAIAHISTIILSKLDHVPCLDTCQKFLRQIFTTWERLLISQPTTGTEVQAELHWHNKYILIGMKTISWKGWRDAGILHVNDLLHESESRFSSHDELNQKYGTNATFLDVWQIRSALPTAWKRKLTGSMIQDFAGTPSFHDSERTAINVLKQSSKQLYYAIILFKKPLVSSQMKWNEVFPVGEDVTQEYWTQIYKRPYQSGRDTKLQSFQYRLCHRIIPCNKCLKNIRIRADDKCMYCQNQDSVQHFLFLCPATRTFWNQICAWLARETDVQIDMSTRSYLFGVPIDTPQDRVTNFLLLFIKFYVYRQKLFHQGQFCLLQLLRELRLRLQVEKYITKMENKQSRFTPWSKIYEALG